MAKTAVDFQHNILMSLHQPPRQFAMYVAPLTLSIDEYSDNLRASLFDRLFTIDPFHYRNETVFTETNRYYFGVVPFLRGHVSIPPHEKVNTSKHYYSYSKSGGNIAWHSGEKLKADFRLSTRFTRILDYAYNNESAGYTMEEFVKYVETFMYEMNEKFVVQPNFTQDSIYQFGYYLKQKWNIKMMILEMNNSRK